MSRIIPAADLSADMTLAVNGALVLDAAIDEGGHLDYAVYLHGRIEVHAIDAADLSGRTFEIAA